MPDWVVGVVGTFALSPILAYRLLMLRCRGIGFPFGPRARPWALLIVVTTAIVSTGAGLIVGAASHQPLAVYAGIIVPSGLWFINVPPSRDRDLRPRTRAALLTLPFSRLYDRMGDDMQDWCDTRLRAASGKPQWIADAVTYYSDQVEGRLENERARADLERWRESITHKTGIVRLISRDTTPARLRTVLQLHPATQNMRRYADGDLLRLARRLEAEALNELYLFLTYVYRLGYYKLPSYPYKPPVLRKSRHTAEVLNAASAE